MTEAAHGTSVGHRRLVLGGMALGLAAMLLVSLTYRLSPHPLTRSAAVPAASSAPAAPPADAPAPSGTIEAEPPTPEQTAIIAAMQKLRADPNDIDTLLELADLFMRQNKPENAQGFINRALVAAPGDARPSYYQGVLSARLGRYPEAADAMTRSLRMQDNPAVRYSLAVLYRYHLNDESKAKEQLEAARAHPDLSPDLCVLVDRELDQRP